MPSSLATTGLSRTSRGCLIRVRSVVQLHVAPHTNALATGPGRFTFWRSQPASQARWEQPFTEQPLNEAVLKIHAVAQARNIRGTDPTA